MAGNSIALNIKQPVDLDTRTPHVEQIVACATYTTLLHSKLLDVAPYARDSEIDRHVHDLA